MSEIKRDANGSFLQDELAEISQDCDFQNPQKPQELLFDSAVPRAPLCQATVIRAPNCCRLLPAYDLLTYTQIRGCQE
jgi:hypothetical protein